MEGRGSVQDRVPPQEQGIPDDITKGLLLTGTKG